MAFDWKRGVLGIIVLIVLILALYLTFGSEDCPNFDCFRQQMIECKFATYVNEEAEASWGYKIIGKSGNMCQIEVTLLGAKEGTLNLRQYEGNSMICAYDLGIATYPEKDLSQCSGELKENLQSVIIDKLFRYIVDNVGEIKEELREV